MRPQTAVAAGAHSGDGPRVTDGLQVLYTFHEGSGGAVYDVSGVGSPLNLTIANTNAVTWQSGGGLQVNTGASKTIIESGVAAGKIINAVAASNEVTIEAWIKPANISQDGPARILTISGDASNRNAMLGQGLWGSQPKDLYNVRLRTSHWSINNNGMPALDGTTGSAATNLTHVVYTRDSSGNAVLYVNGSVDATGNVPGDLSNWDGSYQLALADEFGSGGGREWAGTFYLAAIYDKALSAAEVTQNYLAGSAQPTPTATATTPATHTPTPPATPSPTATPPPAGPSLIQRSTYSLAGQAIAVRVVEKDAGGQVLSNNLTYYLTDHLGSTAQLLNGSNGIVSGSTTRYLPFGGYRTTPTDDVTDRRYTGHRHNDDLGLIYMNARFYVGGIGRFASADTIVPDPANPQSYNRYSYVYNSPLNLVDPDGHNPICSQTGSVCSDGAYDDGVPPPNSRPGSPLVANSYSAGVGARDILMGTRMVKGGFRFAEGTTYPGQIMVYGSHSASRAAGLSPYLRHAHETHSGIQALRNPGSAAAANLTSKFARGSAILAIGANILDFTIGRNSGYGVLSTNFAAANTVDLITGLGAPAAGAAVGTLFAPGPGTLIGGGAGALADAVFKLYSGGSARNAAVNVVNSFYQQGVGSMTHMVNNWSSGSAPLTVYPQTIPSYSPYQIQPSYTYNSTVSFPYYPYHP